MLAPSLDDVPNIEKGWTTELALIEGCATANGMLAIIMHSPLPETKRQHGSAMFEKFKEVMLSTTPLFTSAPLQSMLLPIVSLPFSELTG